jgi:phage terminase large subunit GpA-like protein
VGNVIDLAETRSKTFAGFGRKIIYISTPEIAEMPNTVDDLYQNQSDMRKWFCPCPYCGEYQTLEWSNVKYGHCKERLDDIYIECVSCKGHISELQRMPMVRKGEWRVTNHEQGRADFPGFHFSDLVSPFSSLKNVVKAKELH